VGRGREIAVEVGGVKGWIAKDGKGKAKEGKERKGCIAWRIYIFM
jgi:hypothetical protein